MSALELEAPAELDRSAIEGWFGPRATEVDAGRATVRDGLVELVRLGFADAGIERSVALVSEVARHDLATAFSAWASRSARRASNSAMLLLVATTALPLGIRKFRA